MNNRFRHCSNKNEANMLLRQFLSSTIDEGEKQALQNEYDAYLEFEKRHQCESSHPTAMDDDLEPFYEELLTGISDKKLIERGVICAKCHKNMLDQECCKYCGMKNDKPEYPGDPDNYPPGMNKADFIHVGEIEPDDD